MCQKKIDKFEEEFLEYFEPIIMGLVLLNPLLGITNSGKTLITGSDIYENEADAADKAMSAIDLITSALGAGWITLPKKIATGVRTVENVNDAATVIRTKNVIKDKKGEKR